MKRILMACAGIVAAGLLPVLFPSSLLVYLLLLAFFCLIFRPLRLVGFFLSGFFWGTYAGHAILANQLPSELAGVEIQVRGVISDFPEDRGNSQRFRFSVLAANRIGLKEKLGKNFPKLIQLSWYQTADLALGQEWSLRVKLRRPRGFVNEGGFDYQRWLLSEGIGGTGYVRKSKNNERLSLGHASTIQMIRADIKYWLLNSTDSHIRGPLLALAIGDNSLIDNSQWLIFRETGTAHLMAISGLHIGLVSVFGFFFGRGVRAVLLVLSETLSRRLMFNKRFLWRRLFRRYWLENCLSFLNRLFYFFPALFSILFGLTYAALSGLSLSTQRALVMIVIINVGALISRKPISFHTLVFAMLVVLIVDPLAFYGMGFYLSFSAVGILLFCFSNRVKFDSRENTLAARVKTWVWSLLRSQWGIFIGLAIPLLLLDQGLSFLAPIANIVVIPIVSTIVIIPLLCAVFVSFINVEIAAQVLSIAVQSLELCWRYLSGLQNSPLSFAWFPAGQLHPFAIVAAFLGLLLVLSPKGFPGRLLGGFFFIPLFFPLLVEKPPLRINILEVGQGLAVVVETQTKTLLFDAGPGFSESFNAGSDIVAPFLRKRGVKTIDTMIISHSDNDHAGGANNLLAAFPVGKVISGEVFHIDESIGAVDSAGLSFLKRIQSKQDPELIACDQDIAWQWDDVTFYLIEPTSSLANPSVKARAANPKLSSYNKNNQSCILVIRYGDDVIVIPGDIEAKVERQLLGRDLFSEGVPQVSLLQNKSLQDPLPESSSLQDFSLRDFLLRDVTLLVAPHHGSRTSSTISFVNVLSPTWVVYSSGYKNQYGHPHPAVQARYEKVNSRQLNTSLTGQIEFLWRDKGGLNVSVARNKMRRYWFDGETVNTAAEEGLED